MGSYQHKKPVNKMTFDEIENQFKLDCAELLTKENYRYAENKALNAQVEYCNTEHGLNKTQLEIKLGAIYNACFAEALRVCCGIYSWRQWRIEQEANKPNEVKGHQQKAAGLPADSGAKKSDKMPEAWRGKILRDAGI